MNIRIQTIEELPLAVDLDGTLISADLLWESAFQLLKQNPLLLFLMPIWLIKGKAHLKAEIAKRIQFDASALPYREEFLTYLNAERASGRELLLVTAAAEPLAQAVAAHLGIFSSVHASTENINLATKRKAALLVDTFGKGGFDYAGNDRADLPVFEAARSAIVVAPDKAAGAYGKRTNSRRFDGKKATWRTYAKMLRVHQWLKNLLVFAPAILAHEIASPGVFVASVLAFLAFSAAASAIYIINDILDLPLDRQHASKRKRPFADGTLSIPFGLAWSMGLLAVAGAISLMLPPAFALVLALYAVVTTAYSLSIKRMLLVDVLCLAGLYSMRLLAGKAAADIPPSFWLIAFGMFFFLSLALVKRHVELQVSKVSERDRIAGRGYRPEDLAIVGQAGIASAFAAALVLSLYIQAQDALGFYTHAWFVWPLVPIVLYINVRIWILTYRKEMPDDPVVFLATDWRSQMFIGIGVALMVAESLL